MLPDNNLTNILNSMLQAAAQGDGVLGRAARGEEECQARMTRLFVPPAEQNEVEQISNNINAKMQEIKQLFSGKAGYEQIEKACTELEDDMKRQKWIPPGEDMKTTYGIFGFRSAQNAVEELHEYAQTIIDTLNTPDSDCDVQTKREILSTVKSNVETTVETLTKSLSEKDRKVPQTCNTIKNAFLALTLINSIVSTEQRIAMSANDLHQLS